jgi:hypothetical protein
MSAMKTISALESGDADAAKQVLVASASGISYSSSMSGGRLRRVLLSESSLEGKMALRSDLLSFLFLTFDITPTTKVCFAHEWSA